VSLFGDALAYIRDDPAGFWQSVWDHLRLSLTAIGWAIALFFPLGVLVSRTGRIGAAIVAGVAAVRVVPSLAVLFLLYPILGLGDKPALVALTALAGPPIVVNTDAGLRAVAPAILDNARGLGMNALQVFGRVQLPLAAPVVVAGIRTATVEVIASATLAAFIGAGGLGGYITAGLTLLDYPLLLVGGIPVTIMALLAEASLGAVERRLAPPVA
jgi:osmoprotectant transport system permease protein